MMQHEVATPALLEQQAKRFSLADAQGKTRVCTSPGTRIWSRPITVSAACGHFGW